MDKKKIMFITGAVIAAIAVIAIILGIVLSGSSRDYESLYDEAEMAFLSGDYDTALAKAEEAMDIEPTAELYLLMAECYYAREDLDMAIQILYLGYSRVGGDSLAQRLDEFKAEKGSDESASGTPSVLTIDGREITPDTRSLLLSEKNLTDSDIAGLSTLYQLESLSLSDNNLTDISVLKNLTTLNFLQINGNRISDISALALLTNLKTLYIDDNPIADFTPLHGLSALRTLSMKGVHITESQLEALQEALPNCKIYADNIEEEVVELSLGGITFTSDVTELDLGGLGITDISVLSQCTELVHLDLRDNSITDISPLIDLQKLEYLCIWNNKVSDLGPLMTLSDLKFLDADNNEVKDISVLRHLTAMEELWLSGNDLNSISPLAELPALRRLGLKNTGLTDSDLELLAGIETLTELAIEDNAKLSAEKFEELQTALPNCKITHSELLYTVKFGDAEFKSDATSLIAVGMGIEDISGLDKFTALKTLVLSDNKISDLAPISGLTGLEALDLYGNEISDVSQLKALTALRSLSLLDNSISDLEPLRGMSELRELHLSFNEISDIEPLVSLQKLEELDLDGNRLTDITELAFLTNLKNLSLENNDIRDLAPLYTLKNLETLYLRGNKNLRPDHIRVLQSVLPNCTIVCDFDLSEEPAEEDEDSGYNFPGLDEILDNLGGGGNQ